MTRAAMRLAPRTGVLAILAALFCAAAVLGGQGAVKLVFATIGGALLSLIGVIHVLIWQFRRAHQRAQEAISEFVCHDAAPCFVTDDEGRLWYANHAAERRFDTAAETLAGVLEQVFANPSAVLYRLQKRAETGGAAREDVATRRGHVRLAAHRLGHGGVLWRIEEMGDRSARSSDALHVPAITVGRNNAVLFMNASARQLIGERVKSLDRIFKQLPVQSGVVYEIATRDGPQRCLVAEVTHSAGRRELYLVPVPAEASAETAEAARNGEPGDSWRRFEALPVPLLRVSPDGEVLESNRLARDLLGVQDCAGLHLSTLMEGLGRSITDWLGEVARGREANASEFLRVSRNDRETFVQVMLKRAADAGDRALIAVLNDATELKTLEMQFVQSQKMQAIGQLAGGVAHDFNNLLTAISGHCDLLLLRHDQSDQDYNDLVQINQNANRAAALVSQLLAFSRKQTLRPEVLDLRDTLSDLTHLLNRLVGEKVTLTLDHDPADHRLRADKRQLEQVVMNIVVNARDAMPGGGEIRIATESLVLSEPMQRDRAVVPAGSFVQILIQDQGNGIPPDKMQKIFEPFYTTKRTGEGTGLGLSTAYGIVKQTGGFIFADSVVGEGTVFRLIFPTYEEAVDAPAAPQQETVPDAPTRHSDAVILLVEDEAPVRAFASRALRLRGYTVLEAESAEDALKTLEETDLHIDIFVTDVVMPGMDGPSWVRKALESHPGVRVVFVSGYAEDAFGEGRPKIPNSVFLPKPFSLTELTEIVQRQLH
ncbi:hybrid sensor histidine kinase/response regulator [Marimonas lutisalis]|uniref:hybrid sensor histidine kinase/response regulator n=1 Tax=Marimonas lutisalis TaxID=2545756 RepID=UPI0010FA4357|nr:ATP-binding protein [Marimonas lutisalis]